MTIYVIFRTYFSKISLEKPLFQTEPKVSHEVLRDGVVVIDFLLLKNISFYRLPD